MELKQATARRRSAATLQASLLMLIAATLVAATSSACASGCLDATRGAELRHGIPAGLLAAIAHVESGNRAFSVNGNGRGPGRQFDTIEAATQYVQGMLATGNRLIDLGCLQVDLLYHPDAFRQWQDAFDSDLNAEAAAGILSQLHDRTGDWRQAVALYHSADPARGQSYLRLVTAAWGDGGALMDADASPSAADPYVIEASSTSGVAVWLPGMTGLPRQASNGSTRRLPRVITP